MSQKTKPPRGKRGTYTRVISRTTSESLRLVEPEKSNGKSTPASLTLPPPPQKPASSFVVTSVVHSHTDGAIDSPEDESHSDDISRVTDLETPSCSEETYSKDVDEEGAVSLPVTESNQPITVPLESRAIPSLFPNIVSQIDYNPVRMQSSSAEQEETSDDVFVAKCDRCIGRFQVVKVESIVPFHRGRWKCHDYLDNSKHAPDDGWVFYKERFIKKSDLAELKTKEQRNISTVVVTSTVTTTTVGNQFQQQVCQFKTYSTNISGNSYVTMQSNVQQQITTYAVSNPQQTTYGLKYANSGVHSMQYQASPQQYPVITTVQQQQIFTGQSTISSPSVQPQRFMQYQTYNNQSAYYGTSAPTMPFTPQTFVTSTYGVTNTYSAPIQTPSYQGIPQTQLYGSYSEPVSAQQGSSNTINPFVFPYNAQVSGQNPTAQSQYINSQGQSVMLNQNTNVMTTQQQSFPISSTVSYQPNISVYQQNLNVTCSVGSYVQTGPCYVNPVTQMQTSTASIYQPVAGAGYQTSDQRLPPVYQNQTGVLPAQNQCVQYQNIIPAPSVNPMPMQENIPAIRNIIHTPPQTPTNFPSQTIQPVAFQSIQQASVMNTPPQTPVNILNQPIYQSIGLSQEHSLSGQSILGSPFSSVPSVLSDRTYQFLPIVAFAPIINGSNLMQPRPLPTTTSHSLPPSPTYCFEEGEEVTGMEARRIITCVANYLDKGKVSQRSDSTGTSSLTPVDNEEEYIILVKKTRSASLTHITLSGSVEEASTTESSKNTYHETPKLEPRKIGGVSKSLDRSDTSFTLTENVITMQAASSSKYRIEEVEDEDVIVDSIINNSIADNDSVIIDVNLEDASKFDINEKTVTETILNNISRRSVNEQQSDVHEENVTTVINGETGRVILRSDTKSKTYIPPFSNLKGSGTKNIESMTFINTSLLENIQAQSFSGEAAVSSQEQTTSGEIIQVDEAISVGNSIELPPSTDNLPKSFPILEDVQEHTEVVGDSCDSQSDNTIVFITNLAAPTSFSNDSTFEETDQNIYVRRQDIPTQEMITSTSNLDSNDLTINVEEQAASPQMVVEDQRYQMIISLDSGDSSPTYEVPETQQESAISSCACLEEINRVTSCTSAVIDHKIEQAMDLVKSHLMSSMRAEVDGLKARIAELIERIHQLEIENDFLKANASPEVLIALNNGAARIQEPASVVQQDFPSPTSAQSTAN